MRFNCVAVLDRISLGQEWGGPESKFHLHQGWKFDGSVFYEVTKLFRISDRTKLGFTIPFQ
jgi:hypothetical protein